MVVIDLLKKLGYSTVDEDYYELISTWQKWYSGKVKEFHEYSVYNGITMTKQEKYSLAMAKTVCEDWSNYIFNKDTKITTNNDAMDIALNKFFHATKFMTNINQCVESAFAMGTSATVIIKNADGVDLNYIKDARMIFPLSWDNGEIIDCCFASNKVIDGKKTIYLNIHEFIGGKWVITNKFYALNRNGKPTQEIAVDGVLDRFTSDVKMYATYSPATLNNFDMDSPLGMSIFANAIDAIKGVDNAYDSYNNEFILGKKRIMASTDIMRRVINDSGDTVPTFVPSDVVFYHIPGSQTGEIMIKEIDMTLRVAEHKDGLQDMLSALSIKVGMGTKHYSFVGGAVTATEVKSTSDTLYNSMIKHETPLTEYLETICNGALYHMGYKNVGVAIEYDDSVIRDTNQDLMNNLQLLQNRVIGRADVAAYWKGMDRQKALEYINQIDGEEVPQTDIYANDIK